jgi:hypothetical protein
MAADERFAAMVEWRHALRRSFTNRKCIHMGAGSLDDAAKNSPQTGPDK